MMTEERRRAWENAWESQRNKLEQNLQISQFYFDLRAVGSCRVIRAFIRASYFSQKLAVVYPKNNWNKVTGSQFWIWLD